MRRNAASAARPRFRCSSIWPSCSRACAAIPSSSGMPRRSLSASGSAPSPGSPAAPQHPIFGRRTVEGHSRSSAAAAPANRLAQVDERLLPESVGVALGPPVNGHQDPRARHGDQRADQARVVAPCESPSNFHLHGSHDGRLSLDPLPGDRRRQLARLYVVPPLGSCNLGPRTPYPRWPRQYLPVSDRIPLSLLTVYVERALAHNNRVPSSRSSGSSSTTIASRVTAPRCRAPGSDSTVAPGVRRQGRGRDLGQGPRQALAAARCRRRASRARRRTRPAR